MHSRKDNRTNSQVCISIIGNQALSLINFRESIIIDMVKRGIRVLALAPDYDDAKRDKVRAMGAQPIDFSLSRNGMNPLRDIADMLRLALLLQRLDPVISFAYFTKPVIYGTLAAWIVNIPKRFAMIEGLGYAFSEEDRGKSLKLKILRWIIIQLYTIALHRTERVFFLNEDDVKEFIHLKIISSNKVVQLSGIGVDLDKWKPVQSVMKPATFLLAARLLKEKGIIEYANAAKVIKQKHPDTQFILLGSLDSNPGALSRHEIEQLSADCGIKWHGYVPDVRPWIARASVFVLPSYYREGVPRSIQEAMAMARPIITTDAPGCRETVIEGENGFLIPLHNIDALIDAMQQFILHPQLIERMGQSSRRIAEERFDEERINQIIMREMGVI